MKLTHTDKLKNIGDIFMKNDKQIILFGTGSSAQATEALVNRVNLKVDGYTDNNQQLWGQYKNGKPIFSPSNLNIHHHIIIIASMYKKEIAEQLDKLGFIEHQSYLYPENFMFINNKYTYVKEEPIFPKPTNILENIDTQAITIYDNQEMLQYSKPIILDSKRYPNFIFPQQDHPNGEVSIQILKDAYTLGNSGIIFDNQVQMIKSLSTLSMVNMGIWDGRRWDETFFENLVPTPFLMKLNGNIAVTSTRWSGVNYYHWMFEELPRFYILKKSGIRINKFISNFRGYEFQKCSLEAINIKQDDIISSSDSYGFQTETLVVPYSPYYDSGYVSTWVCDFLRKTFLNKFTLKENKYKRIYITRGSARYRKIHNEEALIEILKKYDFKILDMGNFNIYEQANIFNSAEVIIGIHGAALSNVVFCKPQTKLVEIFNPLYMPTMYWGIASQVGVEYYCSIGKSLDTHFNETEIEILLSKDIEVDLEQIQKFLTEYL